MVQYTVHPLAKLSHPFLDSSAVHEVPVDYHTVCKATKFWTSATRSQTSPIKIQASSTMLGTSAQKTRTSREALLSEAGFEKVFRTQNWVRRRKLFCRWFCFLLEQAGCISVAAWTHLKLASYDFVASGGLIVCRYKKAHQPFATLRWLLEVFLAVAEFVGFRAGGRLPFTWLYWILYCPLLALLAPLDSYRSFPLRKNMNHDLFSQSRY